MNQNKPSKKRILAVDDNAQMLDLVREVLEMAGYDASMATCGRAGLDFILTRPEKIDLLLIDMNIGDMTGPEFLVELEQVRPKFLTTTPAVFISGVESVPKTMATGFIQKPFGINTLLETVRSYVGPGL
ncbi:MAG: response regulator [Bdellovibrio sp.]|nr:response regulator [Bdellovibrio sp.]